MALDGLTLLLAVPAADCDACCSSGTAPRGYAGGGSYLGLREHAQDALDRDSLASWNLVSKATHVLLRVRLTPTASRITALLPRVLSIHSCHSSQRSFTTTIRFDGVAHP